jgi:hypothetical protein
MKPTKPKSRKAAYIRPKNTYAKKPPQPKVQPKDPRQIDWVDDWLEQDERDKSRGNSHATTRSNDDEL